MDLSFNPSISTLQDHSLLVDRLTNLPDELLIRIISSLPTKDALVTCNLSKRMRHVFPWITSLNFDHSPISPCRRHCYEIECLRTFVTFVDNVLHAYKSRYLTRFILRVGCVPCRLPDLKSTQLNAWISFALTRCGLKELDLCLQLKDRSDIQLPSEIFTCETLEVLKLDVNIGLEQVFDMPSFRLPNLKRFHLYVESISKDEFLTSLVSSCPLLEELSVEGFWNYGCDISISSTSLRRLCLRMGNLSPFHSIVFLRIHTPNLLDLEYMGNLVLQYSFTNMNYLVKAHINIFSTIRRVYCLDILSLIRSFSNVQHLCLIFSSSEILLYRDLKDRLPVFRNLKCLELGIAGNVYWNGLLLAFLNFSLVLETLVFLQGISSESTDAVLSTRKDIRKALLKVERGFCRTTQDIIPWCCRFHLKRIVIKHTRWEEREIDLIRFCLRHALVLEELVIYPCRSARFSVADQMEIHNALQNLPRASLTCSFVVHEQFTD